VGDTGNDPAAIDGRESHVGVVLKYSRRAPARTHQGRTALVALSVHEMVVCVDCVEPAGFGWNKYFFQTLDPLTVRVGYSGSAVYVDYFHFCSSSSFSTPPQAEQARRIKFVPCISGRMYLEEQFTHTKYFIFDGRCVAVNGTVPEGNVSIELPVW